MWYFSKETAATVLKDRKRKNRITMGAKGWKTSKSSHQARSQVKMWLFHLGITQETIYNLKRLNQNKTSLICSNKKMRKTMMMILMIAAVLRTANRWKEMIVAAKLKLYSLTTSCLTWFPWEPSWSASLTKSVTRHLMGSLPWTCITETWQRLAVMCATDLCWLTNRCPIWMASQRPNRSRHMSRSFDERTQICLKFA